MLELLKLFLVAIGVIVGTLVIGSIFLAWRSAYPYEPSVAAAKPAPSFEESLAKFSTPRYSTPAPIPSPIDKFTLDKMNWRKSGFGSVAVADLTFKNDNDYAVKDALIECEFEAESGTTLSRPHGTIYKSALPFITDAGRSDSDERGYELPLRHERVS